MFRGILKADESLNPTALQRSSQRSPSDKRPSTAKRLPNCQRGSLSSENIRIKCQADSVRLKTSPYTISIMLFAGNSNVTVWLLGDRIQGRRCRPVFISLLGYLCNEVARWSIFCHPHGCLMGLCGNARAEPHFHNLSPTKNHEMPGRFDI